MKSTYLRLLLQRSGSRRLFSVSIIAALLWSSLIVASALILSRVIVAIIDGDPKVAQLLITLAILWGFRAIFQAGFEYWCSKQAILIKKEIRNEITTQLDSYSHLSPSLISTLLVKGLNSLDIYLGRFVPQLCFASITPVVIIGTLFLLDPLSAVIAILTLPLIPIFGALIGKYTADSVKRKWRTLGLLSAYFEDSLRGFVTLKIFGRHKSQANRIEEMGDRYTRETMKVLKISFLSALALELCATISVALIAVSIGLRLVNSNIGFTTSLAALILAPEVYFPLRNAASLFHASADGAAALAKLQSLQQQIAAKVEQVDVDFSSIGQITWHSWSLAIAGRARAEIAGNTLESGQIHFIVGESGIGKSRFILNLLGIQNEAQVSVQSNGSHYLLQPQNQQAWFKQVGWVPQLPQLAQGSLRQQFTLIANAITDSQIEILLTKCGLEISELPDGLESKMGQTGENATSASGGQIRKIAIARSLASLPQLLIADEPTADLDSASAEQVMQTLRAYAKSGAIVVCITHDLSIVQPRDSQQSFLVEAIST